ncbi:MAG: polyphosphate kinase 1 [Bacteroidota bacterium]
MDKAPIMTRDTSWLSFNHRVLQEAQDRSVPLYERIKFLAIYSSNLDEFFRVRVSGLRRFKELKKSTRKALLNVRPKKELKNIQAIVAAQQEELGHTFRNVILPELAENGIGLVGHEQFTPEQQSFAADYFSKHLAEAIRPIYCEGEKVEVFLNNKALYFFVALSGDPVQYAVVEIPADRFPRFITLPENGQQQDITYLDDILRAQLGQLFGDKEILGAWSIKLSRDAELYIDDEYSGDLITKLKESLAERNVGLPTRFLYDSSMPEEHLKQIKAIFGLKKADLVPGARYHNFSDFFGLPDPTNNPALHDKKMEPLPHRELEAVDSFFSAIREKDFILHYPYNKYDYVPKFIEEAADDPLVEHIGITLYRVAAKSMVTTSLLKALEAGKAVTVFVEAKARFDEESNLFWGEELTKAGAKVIYSYPGIKVHTKLLLISRKEEEGTRQYAYIATGNFNEKTSKLYCDHGLFTSNPKVAEEVQQIFRILDRTMIVPKTKHIFISPFNLRSSFEALIDKEIKNAKAGKEAYMILKMNSIEDPGMVKKLYEASRAGVKIQMIVRGICCLMPCVEGYSENIEVISILDRFLEHARVYIFGNGGKEKMYFASADWMTRNLDRRIEVAIPIFSPHIFDDIRNIINIQLADNQKARIIDAEQTNPYKLPEEGEEPIRAQTAIYEYVRSQHLVDQEL